MDHDTLRMMITKTAVSVAVVAAVVLVLVCSRRFHGRQFRTSTLRL